MPAAATDIQKKFAVEFVTNGGNATAAAIAAGYSERSAHELGRKTLNKPAVAELIRNALYRMRARSGAIGLNALIEICEDKKVPANARVSAAKALCEHAGILGAGKVEQADEELDRGEPVDAKQVLTEFRKLRLVSNGVQDVLS